MLLSISKVACALTIISASLQHRPTYRVPLFISIVFTKQSLVSLFCYTDRDRSLPLPNNRLYKRPIKPCLDYVVRSYFIKTRRLEKLQIYRVITVNNVR